MCGICDNTSLFKEFPLRSEKKILMSPHSAHIFAKYQYFLNVISFFN